MRRHPKLLAANVALVRPFVGVSSGVNPEFRRRPEAFPARRARVSHRRLFVGVPSQVALQLRFVEVRVAAHRARMGTFAGVLGTHVVTQRDFLRKRFAALEALVPVPAVYPLVRF